MGLHFHVYLQHWDFSPHFQPARKAAWWMIRGRLRLLRADGPEETRRCSLPAAPRRAWRCALGHSTGEISSLAAPFKQFSFFGSLVPAEDVSCDGDRRRNFLKERARAAQAGSGFGVEENLRACTFRNGREPGHGRQTRGALLPLRAAPASSTRLSAPPAEGTPRAAGKSHLKKKIMGKIQMAKCKEPNSASRYKGLRCS